MREFLVFQIYGAMAAWGDIAVGETRRSAAYPTKSAILGLLAAALGIDREDDTTHHKIASAYGFGCKVISSGSLLIDFHTVQVPPQQRKAVLPTRKAELSSEKLGTLLSSREYRCDASYIIAVWLNNQSAPFSLKQLSEALLHPIYTIYLGRKSCLPGLPLNPKIIDKSTLKEALDSQTDMELILSNGIRLPETRLYYWEDIAQSGLEPEQQLERWDLPLSKKRWQFNPRLENLFVEDKEL
ncbi:MAG: type I-E CRISPR-associated protein Cas5/CasD [Desulfobacterales bacterium]